MSNTLFVGKVYHRFEELPSTNDWAAELLSRHQRTDLSGAAKTKPPEGMVVRADNQTAGRGQLGSRWQSKRGENLLLSIILYPHWLEAQAQFYLSMAVALGLREAILELRTTNIERGASNSIKWPNDIYVGDRKIAGILIQNSLSGTRLQSSIVGIGLNVNQTEFPEDLPNPGSLALAYGHTFDLDTVASVLFESLERRYLQLKAGHFAAIKGDYETRLWRRGERSSFVRTADHFPFEGVILGVSDNGMLRVETDAGLKEFEVKGLSMK